MNSTAHCENCSCPKEHTAKTPLPRFATGGEDEPQNVALFMAQSVHDAVLNIMNNPKEFGAFYTGKLSLHFEYDPAYMRDQLITTWKPRD